MIAVHIFETMLLCACSIKVKERRKMLSLRQSMAFNRNILNILRVVEVSNVITNQYNETNTHL